MILTRRSLLVLDRDRSIDETSPSICATSSNIPLGEVDFAEETLPRSNTCSERRPGYWIPPSSPNRSSTSTFPRTSRRTCKRSDRRIGGEPFAKPVQMLLHQQRLRHQYLHSVARPRRTGVKSSSDLQGKRSDSSKQAPLRKQASDAFETQSTRDQSDRIPQSYNMHG